MTPSIVIWLALAVGQLPPPIAQVNPNVPVAPDLEDLIRTQELISVFSRGSFDMVDLIDPDDYFIARKLPSDDEQAMLNELSSNPNTAPEYVRQLLAIKWLGTNKIGKAAPGLHRLESSPSQFVRAYATWALPEIGHRPRQRIRHVGWRMTDGLQSFPQNIDGLIWLGLPQLTEARPLTEKERDILFDALDLDTEDLFNFVDIAGNIRIDAAWVAVRDRKNIFLHIKGRASAPWLKEAFRKLDKQAVIRRAGNIDIIDHPDHAAALFTDAQGICTDVVIVGKVDPQKQRKPAQLLQECLDARDGRIPSAVQNHTITRLMKSQPNTILAGVIPANPKKGVFNQVDRIFMNIMKRGDGSSEWHWEFIAKPGQQPNAIVNDLRAMLNQTTNEITQLQNRPNPANGVQTPVAALNQLAGSIRQTRITAHGARVTMTLELPVVPLSLEFIEDNQGIPAAPVNAPPVPPPFP